MPTLVELTKIYETRKAVANRKVDVRYRDEYNKGVTFAYSEVLEDLYGMVK